MKRTIVNPVIKDSVTFIRTAAESGGAVTEIEITLMPGGGNPLHYHKTYSETFTALGGELGVKLGKGRTKILQPGESYTVAPMEVHSFFNPSDEEIQFNVEIEPGHEGFENSLRILYGLAADGLTNKKAVPTRLKHVALIADMSDMYLPGIVTLFAPLLKRVARKARANGEDQQLIKRYCR